jgi:general secretion pathway protein G
MYKNQVVHRFKGSAVHRSSGAGEAGWTLIELLIVLSIIVILASMALVTYTQSVKAARESALHSDLFLMRDAIDQYYADKGKYPDSLQTLVSEAYMRAIPKNPFVVDAEWITSPAPTPPGGGATDSGIYQVKSGFNGTGMDGTQYSEW